MKKLICAALALALPVTAAACLAEATPESTPESTPVPVYERETVIAGYETMDDGRHIVYAETWEYPIVDGQRGSGRPVAEDEGDAYTEPHHFTKDVCDDCNAQNAAQPGTFINASGAVVAQGAPAAEVLKQVFAAIPEDIAVTVLDVEADQAASLTDAVKADKPQAELATLLANFPAVTLDNVDCRVVGITYMGKDEWQVREHYAFSAADSTLVKLY